MFCHPYGPPVTCQRSVEPHSGFCVKVRSLRRDEAGGDLLPGEALLLGRGIVLLKHAIGNSQMNRVGLDC